MHFHGEWLVLIRELKIRAESTRRGGLPGLMQLLLLFSYTTFVKRHDRVTVQSPFGIIHFS
jgi:hypothetical protein